MDGKIEGKIKFIEALKRSKYTCELFYVLNSHGAGCAGRPGHAARIATEQGYLATVNADIALIGAQIPTTAWAQAAPPDGDWTRTMAHYNRDPVVVQTRTNQQHQDALAGWQIVGE